jgi:hypothetical protein
MEASSQSSSFDLSEKQIGVTITGSKFASRPFPMVGPIRLRSLSYGGRAGLLRHLRIFETQRCC